MLRLIYASKHLLLNTQQLIGGLQVFIAMISARIPNKITVANSLNSYRHLRSPQYMYMLGLASISAYCIES